MVAGVSTQTVSRVINDRPDVSPETRERILRVIDQLSYRPSALARSLIQRRSYSLGVVTAGLKYIGPSRTLNGITGGAAELGYALILEELPHFETEDVKPLLQNLLARHVDGIVWAVPQIGDNHRWVRESLREIPIPIIFISSQAHPGASSVAVDNRAGAALAVRHLLERGRRRIGHISGPLDWWEARERKLAWNETLEGAGAPTGENQWAEGNWSSSSGEAAFEQLLRSYPGMDAVFVGNDQMALSVLSAAHRKGMRIPQDLAVVGFDNIVESAYFWPSLTTVHQDQHELGCRAVQELAAQIELAQSDQKIEPKTIMLTAELIVRDSSITR